MWLNIIQRFGSTYMVPIFSTCTERIWVRDLIFKIVDKLQNQKLINCKKLINDKVYTVQNR